MNPISRRAGWALATAAAVLLAGCATGGAGGAKDGTARARAGAAEDAVTAVQRRAQERWDLLLAVKPEQAYDYLSEGVRSTQTREAYGAEMRTRPVHWTSAKVVDATCEDADACTVAVDIEYKITMPNQAVGTIASRGGVQERWIRVGKGWFHVPQKFLDRPSS